MVRGWNVMLRLWGLICRTGGVIEGSGAEACTVKQRIRGHALVARRAEKLGWGRDGDKTLTVTMSVSGPTPVEKLKLFRSLQRYGGNEN